MKRLPREHTASLLTAYLLLRFREMATRQKSSRALCRAKLLGFNVQAFSYTGLRGLFDEVFLGNEYYFCPSTDRPLILDLGSNIGISVLFFKWLYPGARIIAFEADGQIFEVLKENVRANGLLDVDLHNVAVYDAEGTVDLYSDPVEPGSAWTSTRMERLPGGLRKVIPCTRLSNYINTDVDFLKMDIEGAELRVLHDLAAHSKLKRIKEFVVEYHHHISPDGDEMSALFTLLEKNGFGYQVSCFERKPFSKRKFQDILVYGYRK